MSKIIDLQATAKKAKEGDKRSYAALLNALLPMARKYCSTHILKESEREDCVQEILLSAHRALATYDEAKPFNPWFYAICNFRVKDYLRKIYRNQEDTQDDTIWEKFTFSEENVTNSPSDNEEDVRRLLSTLKPRQREMLIMSKAHGYTSSEIAQKLGMSVSAVKVSIHRTIKQLKDTGGTL
jgi:RNA polymerase sigma-70 factor (ECF subfamily)